MGRRVEHQLPLGEGRVWVPGFRRSALLLGVFTVDAAVGDDSFVGRQDGQFVAASRRDQYAVGGIFMEVARQGIGVHRDLMRHLHGPRLNGAKRIFHS